MNDVKNKVLENLKEAGIESLSYLVISLGTYSEIKNRIALSSIFNKEIELLLGKSFAKLIPSDPNGMFTILSVTVISGILTSVVSQVRKHLLEQNKIDEENFLHILKDNKPTTSPSSESSPPES